MDGAGILLVWLILSAIGATVTVWWSRRIWRRRKELPTRTRVTAVVVATSAMLGALGTAVGLVKAFGAVGGESVDPSQKARILAEGISEAINCTAFGVIVWVPSVIVLALATRKKADPAE